MSPDTPETRIGRLERGLAKLEQRVEDFMADTLTGIREDLQDCAAAVKTLRAEIEQERKQLVADRRSGIRWMVGTVIATAGLIVAATALLINNAGP